MQFSTISFAIATHIYVRLGGCADTVCTPLSVHETVPFNMAGSIETIDPSGDIILAVGTNEAQKKLRVSSERLSNSSPVFKALLRPQYNEGSKIRTSKKPVELALPDGLETASISFDLYGIPVVAAYLLKEPNGFK
ncbi:hypothetical protein AC579_9858 [Pseudocercospora musae]|uniref:BTB domain-containing protein n=1 Tax=Pseudocercospora musae TaxID=113226 RepID=A0A139I836_9PEZI|nr:hypothetical protein AC579_9858 [Pseudocercospora musae]